MVQRIKSKNSWRVQFVDVDGKRKSHVFSTKSDAIEFEGAVQVTRTRSKAGLSLPAKRILFIDAMGEYLRNREKEAIAEEIASSHQSTEADRVTATWVPALGHQPLSAITPEMIKTALTKIRDSGKSGATCNRHRAILSAFFEYAIENKLGIEHNPIRHVPPFSEKKQVRPHGRIESDADVERFVARAYEHSEWFGCFETFMVFDPARIGETLALHWEDLDFLEQLIHIHRIIEKSTGTEKLRTKSHKAGGGYDMAMVPRAREALLRWRAVSKFTKPADYVFCDSRGRHFLYNYVYRIHTKICRELGLRVTPHGLRSTCATHLEDSGATKSDLQQLMGHKHISTTERYTKKDRARAKELAKKLSRMSFGGGNDAQELHRKDLKDEGKIDATEEVKDNDVGGLGRQDSNLGILESKSSLVSNKSNPNLHSYRRKRRKIAG